MACDRLAETLFSPANRSPAPCWVLHSWDAIRAFDIRAGHRDALLALGVQRWMSESSLMMQIEPSSAGVASV